jgi:hypothetical protein
LGQQFVCLYTIQEGYPYSIRPDERRHRLYGIGQLPGFDGHKDDINRPDISGSVRGRNYWQPKVTVNAVDTQSVFSQLVKVTTACNEADLLSRQREAATEIAAHGTRAKYSKFHRSVPPALATVIWSFKVQ